MSRSPAVLVTFLALFIGGVGTWQVQAQGVRPSAWGRGAQSPLDFTRSDSLRGGQGPGRRSYDVLHYDLDLDIAIDRPYLSGIMTITYRPRGPHRDLQIDLDHRLRVDSLYWEGQRLPLPARPRPDSGAFFIREPDVALSPTGARDTSSPRRVRIQYSGTPRLARNPPWEGGIVFRQDGAGAPWIGMTCQGLGGRTWMPCKDDMRDKADQGMTVTARIPDTLELAVVAGGRLLSDEKMESPLSRAGISRTVRQMRWQIASPISTYVASFTVGRLAPMRDSLEGLPISYWMQPDHRNPESYAYLSTQTHQALKGYQALLGPYPFARDGYKLVETPYIGMEHQSNIAYGDELEQDRIGGMDFILVHETGHEWLGNHVTAADNAHLWIHEGFTTYVESLLIERRAELGTPAWAANVAHVYRSRQRDRIKRRSPILGPEDVYYHRWADSDIYYRASWMLHTLRMAMAAEPGPATGPKSGEGRFLEALRTMITRFGGVPVLTADIAAHWQTYTAIPVAPFFQAYLTTTADPVLEWWPEKKRGRAGFSLRWAEVPAGMALPLHLQVDGGTLNRTIRAEQTTWVPARDGIPPTIDARDYLITMRPRSDR